MDSPTATILTWLILLPLAAAPFIYLFGRISVRREHGTAAPARWLALITLLATWIPLYSALQAVLAGTTLATKVGGLVLRFDGISLALACTVLALGTLVCIFSFPYMQDEPGEEKYYSMLTAMIGTMIGLGCATDLFNLWVWFEAMALTSFLLVAFYRRQPGALEAGLKYLVQSAVGSAFVLLGIALVFSQTGTLELAKIHTAIQTPSLAILAAGALFFIGFGVKIALAPMHTWLPDAHSQAPSGISAMLSGVVIETGLIALLRALGALSAAASSWGALILAFGAINMLLGNLMALRQTQVKRLLAYSSISHMGYMLVGFGAAVAFQQANSAAGGFFHLINHGLMKGLAFLAAGVLLYVLYLGKGSHQSLSLDDLNGASRRYPLAAFALSVALLSLGGLPPLSGFMSKWQIFVGGFETKNTAVIVLVIFAALNSVLSLGYYAPMVNRLYRREPSASVKDGIAMPWVYAIPLVILVAVVVAAGFVPTLFDFITSPAAKSLLALFS